MEIASKLHQGISMEKILDDIRDTIQGRLGKEHLTSKQDLHNIKNQHNIQGIMRHSNDLISVTCSMGIEEMKSLPIVIFSLPMYYVKANVSFCCLLHAETPISTYFTQTLKSVSEPVQARQKLTNIFKSVQQ